MIRAEIIENKYKIALIKLLESNVFNVDSIIDHIPNKKVRQLLCKTESGKDLLEHTPE